MMSSDWSEPDDTDYWSVVQCGTKEKTDGISIKTDPRLPLSSEEHLASGTDSVVNYKPSKTDCYLGKLTRNIMFTVKEAFPIKAKKQAGNKINYKIRQLMHRK